MQSNHNETSPRFPVEPLCEGAGMVEGHPVENAESHIDHLKRLQTYVACQIDEEISAAVGKDSAVTRWRIRRLNTIASVLSILVGLIKSASIEQVHWYLRWATDRLAELGCEPVFAASIRGGV